MLGQRFIPGDSIPIQVFCESLKKHRLGIILTIKSCQTEYNAQSWSVHSAGHCRGQLARLHPLSSMSARCFSPEYVCLRLLSTTHGMYCSKMFCEFFRMVLPLLYLFRIFDCHCFLQKKKRYSGAMGIFNTQYHCLAQEKLRRGFGT